MAVIRSLVGSFSKFAAGELELSNNLVCLSGGDRESHGPPHLAAVEYPATANVSSSAATAELVLPADSPRTGTDEDAGNGREESVRAGLKEDARSGVKNVQTLGQLVTETRLRRGLSREQVASEACLPPYYVRMIESDNYDAIPDQLYLQPFFRRYAIFLGLDAQQVVSRFIRDFGKAENEPIEIPASSTSSAKAILLERWRQIGLGVAAIAVLLPCMAWGVERIRESLNSPIENTSVGIASPTTLAPATVREVQAAIVAAAQLPARAPTAIASTRAITTANSKPQIDHQPHIQPRRRHRSGHGQRGSLGARH